MLALLLAHLAEGQQHHHREPHGRDHDLRQGHVRRLKDEEHHRQPQAEDAEDHHLAKRLGGHDYAQSAERDRRQCRDLEEHHLCSTSNSSAFLSHSPSSRRSRLLALEWTRTGPLPTSTTPTSSALSPIREKDSLNTTATATSSAPKPASPT